MNTKTTNGPWQTPDLPANPNGFYLREPVMHTTFEDGNSAGKYALVDLNGQPMPFGYEFDTRKGGLTGFTVQGVEDTMTWDQLSQYFATNTSGKV